MVGALNLNEPRNQWCSVCKTLTNHKADQHKDGAPKERRDQ